MSDQPIPLSTNNSSQTNRKISQFSKIKSMNKFKNQSVKSKEKASSSTNTEASSIKNRLETIHTLLEKTEPESEFQFSEEIMLNNSQNQTREQRQSAKLPWLSILQWMAHTSSCLGLPKEVLYNGFSIFKMFAASEQKRLITVKNSRIIALTSLLLSSKLESMHGNFLLAMHKIVDGSSKIKKEELIEYQSVILKSLKYRIPTKSLITEVLVKIIQIWNKLAQKFDLKVLNFSIRVCSSQTISKSGFIFFRKYIYLIDFVLIRKIVLLPSKFLPQLETSLFYELQLCNIFYHLTQMTLMSSQKQHMLGRLKQAYQQLVQQINSSPRSYVQYFRQSRLLCKQIKKMFDNPELYFSHLDKYFSDDKRANQGISQHFQKQAKLDNQQNKNEDQTHVKAKKNNTIAQNLQQKNIARTQAQNYSTQIEQARLRVIIDRQIYIPLLRTKQSK